jgi:hypothetical protein
MAHSFAKRENRAPLVGGGVVKAERIAERHSTIAYGDVYHSMKPIFSRQYMTPP